MMALRPWFRGPFELIVHAELHFRLGGDFDRRVALIAFDNAIEVAVTNYLSLKPFHRGGRKYSDEQITNSGPGFYQKLKFIETECKERDAQLPYALDELSWYHDQRNKQYHEGTYAAPNLDVLSPMRETALWVFGFLYEITDVEQELEEQLLLLQSSTNPTPPERVEEFDRLIDEFYDEVTVGNLTYPASEVLFRTDPEAYREKALELQFSEPPRLRVAS